MRPFFSIVIPVYEMKGFGSLFLDHSFKVLSEQSFKEFEVIISDQSKDDEISVLCKHWATQLPINYFKYELPEPLGSSSNLNNAISKAEGSWIKILFQDDFLYNTDSLKEIKTFIENNHETEWLASACEHSKDGTTFYRPFYPSWNYNIHYGINTISSPSVITYKNRFEHTLKFDTQLSMFMDVDFYKRMYDIYGEPKFHQSISVVNRTWEGQNTNDISPQQRKNEEKLIHSRYSLVDKLLHKLVTLSVPEKEKTSLGIIAINEHLYTLKRYASKCSSVIEFGTRKGVSTIALLSGCPKSLLSVDLNYFFFKSVEKQIRVIAQECKVEFRFLQADALQLEIDETDFLFIDTFHTYKQLIQELIIHSPKVRNWIAIHNTVTYGLVDEEFYKNAITSPMAVDEKIPDKKGLYTAVLDFISIHKQWIIKEHYTNNNGLTILQRIHI